MPKAAREGRPTSRPTTCGRHPLQWVELGRVEAFATGEMTFVQLRPLEVGDNPSPDRAPGVFVCRKDNSFTLLRDRCTDVGCPLDWDERSARFVTCRGAVFDREGRSLVGPAPRPLDRRKWGVENDVLYAGPLYRVDAALRRVATL